MGSAPDRSATPAVILLDVHMPGIDGFALWLSVPGSTVQTLAPVVSLVVGTLIRSCQNGQSRA